MTTLELALLLICAVAVLVMARIIQMDSQK